MAYIENPKTKGSGILCAIPQKTKCPMKCKGCFYQSGRGYLEPLVEHLPNLPDPKWANDNGYIVRMNDGNDSNVEREKVIEAASKYKDVFYNTAIAKLDFPGPVVLTVNPGALTDTSFLKVKPEKNLMFVRFRTNLWNTPLCEDVVKYYTSKGVPVVLTFMAYDDLNDIPEGARFNYPLQERTTNTYYAISHAAWELIMMHWKDNPLVYSCGRYGCVRWKGGQTGCEYCGNCLREYYRTKLRMHEGK